MTAYKVWDWATHCSRLVVLRSCFQSWCASDRQRMFERRRRAGSRWPSSQGCCRTRTSRRETQSWTRRLVPVTSLAASFWTHCRQRVSSPVMQ